MEAGVTLQCSSNDSVQSSNETSIEMDELGPVCVLGVDDTAESEHAFQYFVDNVHKPGGRLILLHVVEPLVISSNHAIYLLHQLREQTKAEQKERVKRLQNIYEEKMKLLEIHGVINFVYYSLKPGKMLCEMARKYKSNFIIVGHPRKRRPAALSSTIKYLLRKAPCPLMLVRLPHPVADPDTE